MQAGLVTTIIPFYNRAALLREAVASVIAQTWRPIEVIIVDDGSTDDTPCVADALASDVVRVIHQPNGGAGLARETGRLAARGDYIQHLDSDDILLPRKFELQVTALERDASCAAAYGWTRITGEARPWKRTGERIETMFPSMLQSRWWDTTTPLYRADAIRRAGAWTPLRIEEDWEYDCRIAAQGVRLAYVEEWVSETRIHGEQLCAGQHGLGTAALRDRARAHTLILQHARAAGIGENVPEMRHFARELFLLSRQCGAARLARESQMLFALARQASGAAGGRLQFRLYALLAKIVGWSTMGKVSAALDRLRS